MKDIKTKVVEKIPKTLDKAAQQPKELMRKSAEKSKQQLQETAEHGGDSAVQYGSEKLGQGYQKAKGIANSGKKKIQNAAKDYAERTIKKSIKSLRKSVKNAKSTVKTTGKTVKMSGKTVKTSAQAAKATAKTAQATVKAAAQAAKAAAKAAAAAAKTAAKIAIKAVMAAIKAIIAAVKALIALIAAGGWVAVVIIIIVVIILIICSAFGLFFSNDAEEGEPLTEAVYAINDEFRANIDAEIARLSIGDYDSVEVIYENADGNSDILNNWSDVLGVYAVKTMYENEEVLSVTPEKVEKLKNIFNDMNKVEYRTETVTEQQTTTDEKGKVTVTTTTKLIIHINIESLTSDEGAQLYNFTDEQLRLLEELMSPQYYIYFAKILGIDIFDGLSPDDIKNLPTSTLGDLIVQKAMLRLGDPYSQKYRGQGRYVDCSYLTSWAYQQAGARLSGTAATQAKYCVDNGKIISKAQLMPGDLVFWQKTTCTCGRYNEVHHVAIYIGGGRIIEASSDKGKVIINSLWGENGNTWRVIAYARPYV